MVRVSTFRNLSCSVRRKSEDSNLTPAGCKAFFAPHTCIPDAFDWDLVYVKRTRLTLKVVTGDKAFTRLQQEIIRVSSDESIFAWEDNRLWSCGMFAKSPRAFENSGDVVSIPLTHLARPPYSMTNQGLEIELAAPSAAVSHHSMGPNSDGDPNEQIEIDAPLACARLSDIKAPLQVHIKCKKCPNDLYLAFRIHVHCLRKISWGGIKFLDFRKR